MASGAMVLALRIAAGRPGQRVALTRTLGDEPGMRQGDRGTVLWIDDRVHLEMDSGRRLEIVDPDDVRQLTASEPSLPAAPSL